MSENPFVVGAKVILVDTYGDRRLEGTRTIAKVYANGNFILEGDEGPGGPRQWKPSSYLGFDTPRTIWWTAHRTGQHLSSKHLEIYGPEHEAEIVEARVRLERSKRVHLVLSLLGDRSAQRGHITPEQDAALVAFLATIGKENQS